MNRSRPALPEDMVSFLNPIPDSSDIDVLFKYIDAQTADPNNQRGLYFLKSTLLYSLDLFRTKYLPLSDQGERDIRSRVWLVLGWLFDGCDLKIRSERGSNASKVDRNKRRKAANTSSMEKQKCGIIPDQLVFYDNFEFCAVEANKKLYDDTKEKQDNTKLSITCKQMLLNLCSSAPSLQHNLTIVGLSISRMKLSIFELCNPEGVICGNKKVNELCFPVHMLQFRSNIIEL